MCKMNPRVDFVFKKLFGTEESKDILIDLINSIVSEADRVSDIEIRNPYNEKQFLEDKKSVLDIKAYSAEGKWYNIEMQVLPEDSFAKRSLYYWSRLYTGQLQEGAPYSLLTKTICINILNFDQLYDEPSYHNVYKVKNEKSGGELLDEFEIHFIELRKYDETLADSLNTALDRWVNFLKLAGIYDADSMPDKLKEGPSFQKAMQLLERLSATKEEREIYEDRMKWLRDVTSSLETMERRGLEEGRTQGLKEGRAEGLEMGAEKNKRDNALRMLRKGMNIADVAECVDLPEGEIARLAEDAG